MTLRSIFPILAVSILIAVFLFPPVSAFEPLWIKIPDGNRLSSISLSSNGQEIVVGSNIGDVHFLSNTSEILWSIKLPGSQLVKIIPNSSLIVAGSQEDMYSNKGDVRFFAFNGSLRSLTHPGWVSILDVSGNPNKSVVGTKDGSVMFIAPDGTISQISKDPVEGPVAALAVSSDGSTVGYSTWSLNKPHFIIAGKIFRDVITRNQVTSIALSSKGNFFALSDGLGSNGTLYLKTSSGKILWLNKTSLINYLRINSDGSLLITGTNEGYIHAYDRNGTLLWSYAADGPVTALSITPSATKIAAGTSNGSIYLLDNKGNILEDFHNEETLFEGITLIDISPNGSAMIASLNKNEVLYFRLVDATPQKTIGNSTVHLPHITTIPENPIPEFYPYSIIGSGEWKFYKNLSDIVQKCVIIFAEHQMQNTTENRSGTAPSLNSNTTVQIR
jgi:tricorn protease-like protein